MWFPRDVGRTKKRHSIARGNRSGLFISMTIFELEQIAVAAWAGRRGEASVRSLVDYVRREARWPFSMGAWGVILGVLISEAEGSGGDETEQ